MHTGGLNGTFLVSRLEQMVAQSRAASGASPTPSSQATAASGPQSQQAPAVAAADATNSAAPGARDGPAAASGSSNRTLPVPTTEGDDEGQAAVATGVAKDKPKGKSKKRRRGASGGAGTRETDPEGKRVGDTGSRQAEGGKATPALTIPSITGGAGVDAGIGANGGGVGGGAELSRAERNAQQLKWADEVSAAASAAVAAAAALSQAKKEQAKAEAKAKAKQKHKDNEKHKQMETAAAAAAASGGVDQKGAGGSRIPKESKGRSGGRGDSSAPGAVVEGVIDLGGVGDGEEEEAEDGEVTAVGSPAAHPGGAKGDAVPKEAEDAAEEGIVIAKEVPPAGLPR